MPDYDMPDKMFHRSEEAPEAAQSPEVSSGGTGISSGDSAATAKMMPKEIPDAMQEHSYYINGLFGRRQWDAIWELLPVAAQPQDVKAIHSAVLALQCDPRLPVESRVAFLAGVHRSAAVVSQFAAQPVQDKPQEAGQARELTTTELSDPEYMHEYVSELHATIGELLAAQAAPAATVGWNREALKLMDDVDDLIRWARCHAPAHLYKVSSGSFWKVCHMIAAAPAAPAEQEKKQ